MQQCTCTTTQHDNHPGKTCDMPATTDDAYCKECSDKSVKEHAATKPDMLSYQARQQVSQISKPPVRTIGEIE